MRAAIEAARAELDRLRKILKQGTNRQVQSLEEQDLARATAFAWFKNHRPQLASALGETALTDTDGYYKELLAFAGRSTSRSKYDALLKAARSSLANVESESVALISQPAATVTPDAPPDFSPLVSDPKMQRILVERWKECALCIHVGAPLSAAVMMGGLLESLLLARIQREPNKAAIVGASSAPRDKTTGKTLPLNTWTLQNYIDVAHELGWISQTGKDIGIILRDYRNYIHPQKQYSHGVTISPGDAGMLWEIAKSIARHTIDGAP